MRQISIIGLLGVLTAGPLSGVPLDITIPEGQPGNGAAGPWVGTPGYGPGNADNRTMPRTVTGDLWDLEAFLLMDDGRLAVVGTFDLKNGVALPSRRIVSGDIFFNVAGDISSDGRTGWDYVLRPDWLGGSYAVYANPLPSRLVLPTDVGASAPVAYQPGDDDRPIASGSFDYYQDNSLGFRSESANAVHNVAVFDISFLGAGTEFLSHFTMTCGNDLIRGQGRLPDPGPLPVPDSGGTLGLLGLALGWLACGRRRLRAA